MTVTHQDELDGLKAIGRIVADAIAAMAAAVRPGVTTAELDAIAGRLLDEAEARELSEVEADRVGWLVEMVGQVVKSRGVVFFQAVMAVGWWSWWRVWASRRMEMSER